MTITNRIKIFLSLFIIFTQSYAQKPPTDEQLKGLCRDVAYAIGNIDDVHEQDSLFMNIMYKQESKFDIKKINSRQIDLLFEAGGETLAEYFKSYFKPILEKKAENNGLIEVYQYWKYLPNKNFFKPTDEDLTLLKRVLELINKHHKIGDNMVIAEDVLSSIASTDAKYWKQFDLTPLIIQLLNKEKLSEVCVNSTQSIFNHAFVSDISKEEKEEIRKRAIELNKNFAASTDIERKKKNALNVVKYLQGPFATGTLIGNKAPELDFLWISDGNEKTLDDFKGKVVLLDFWGTKCGACIAAFPQVAELRKKFSSDVEIIGITSIMGYFVDKPNKKTINTYKKPEYEISLFPAYMKAMNVNWRMAVTKQDVMNTDYGALAIPHMTLIDKKGNIRYNALDITDDIEAKIKELINE